jgi:signal transduction histidine kinase
VLAEPGFVVGGDPEPARTRLGVPLLRDGISVGVFVLTRLDVRPFTERQIELVQTYAAQAVIAVENARLFNETKQALERQTATADILKVIASSPDDVQPVFDAIAVQSNRLLNGLSTAVYSFVDDVVHLMSFTPVSPAADAVLKALFPIPLDGIIWSETVRKGETFCISDSEDPSLLGRTRDLARARGWRSILFVPLVRDGTSIGVIGVTRVEPGQFADNHVQILKTFADQAVIAISNVELFQEVQQRTRELSKSLDDLRAAQDRLVQTEKLASLGQLTAGIAHEIKNPLNFVNNFSALSTELIEELNESLASAVLDAKTRGDISELTATLKSNLEKVVQHGKRADSIVKSMLLHSREGSGERRSVDINALVEESLNLAYHGARAERPGFQVTLKHDLDPDAGTIELYPQEMTRVLLNMISNGFYAVTKRASEGGNGFEPTVQAATTGFSDRIEIRIRDNGTGIPPEIKNKMFNPFFTTKPAGEGTGLGLSMSHDIVVKQHGGSIDVETESGHFTEFVIILPRTNGGR